MKLISWNVNGLRACMTKGFMDAFKSLNADIFCLQEKKLSEDSWRWSFPATTSTGTMRRKRLFRHGYFYEGRTFKRCLWNWNPGARP